MSDWYKGTNGKFYRESDMEKAVWIVFGELADKPADLEKLKGIQCRCKEDPTWTELADAGQKTDAVSMAWIRKNELGLKDVTVRDIRLMVEEYMREKEVA